MPALRRASQPARPGTTRSTSPVADRPPARWCVAGQGRVDAVKKQKPKAAQFLTISYPSIPSLCRNRCFKMVTVGVSADFTIWSVSAEAPRLLLWPHASAAHLSRHLWPRSPCLTHQLSLVDKRNSCSHQGCFRVQPDPSKDIFTPRLIYQWFFHRHWMEAESSSETMQPSLVGRRWLQLRLCRSSPTPGGNVVPKHVLESGSPALNLNVVGATSYPQ